jgi:hypothetical protein
MVKHPPEELARDAGGLICCLPSVTRAPRILPGFRLNIGHKGISSVNVDGTPRTSITLFWAELVLGGKWKRRSKANRPGSGWRIAC